MSFKTNKNQDILYNKMWQRNLFNARSINVDLNQIFNGSFGILHEILKAYVSFNDTDPVGLLLTLLVCMGHFTENSSVNITNHLSNLNLFLLLVGPSGCGKSKIIAPIKKSIMTAIKALKLSKETVGIIDDFTTASLSARLSKSNVFIVADEAEKPLLELGFYSPGSEVSAGDRIAACKFFGTIPTTKDTMTYHLEIKSHLSFVGATTGRLWPRLISYYAQGNQSDGFSERFIHYAMPKKANGVVDFTRPIDYEDAEDSDHDEDLNEEDMLMETSSTTNYQPPGLAQILIIVHLLGKRQFSLSRNGTKKFLNKVREMQELSQVDKVGDVNYGARIGKGAEILCKLSALAQLVKISGELLLLLQYGDQLRNDDTSPNFIRNVTLLIEEFYPSTNPKIEIEAPSCRFAGHLMCTYLMKMFFSFYNIEPLSEEQMAIPTDPRSISSTSKTIRQRLIRYSNLFFLKRNLTGPMGLLRHFSSEAVNLVLDELIKHELIRQGPFISSTSRGIVHMKSIPSAKILTDPMKRIFIDKILQDANLNLLEYTDLVSNQSVILPKQILTDQGMLLLQKAEHESLLKNLRQTYPLLFKKVGVNTSINVLPIETNVNDMNVNTLEMTPHPDHNHEENSLSSNSMEHSNILSVHQSSAMSNTPTNNVFSDTQIHSTASGIDLPEETIILMGQSNNFNLDQTNSNTDNTKYNSRSISDSIPSRNSSLADVNTNISLASEQTGSPNMFDNEKQATPHDVSEENNDIFDILTPDAQVLNDANTASDQLYETTAKKKKL